MATLFSREGTFALFVLCGFTIITFVYQPWLTRLSNFDPFTSGGRQPLLVDNPTALAQSDKQTSANQMASLPADKRLVANETASSPSDNRPSANQMASLPADRQRLANQTTSSPTNRRHAANQTSSVSDPRSPTKVLLVTKYRSGSSFLGEMLNQNPECIYWFEPLIAYRERAQRERPLTVANFTSRARGDVSLLDLFTETVAQCLDCDVGGMENDVKFNRILKRSPKIKTALMCARAAVDGNLDHCTDLLQSACSGAGIVAVKTIRFPLRQARRLLSSDSSVKVVYYTRDPRGILDSRRTTLNYTEDDRLADHGVDICRELGEDKVHLVTLQADFPDRVLFLRYEDLAKNTTRTVQRLYAFLDEPVPAVLYDWVQANTQAESTARYGTTRDSRATADKWRANLPQDVITRLTEACREVLEQFHYDL